MPQILTEITHRPNPQRRDRSCPRAVKRARHNSYPVKKPGQPASIRHPGPATIHFWPVKCPLPPAHAQTTTPPPVPTRRSNIAKGPKRVPDRHARPLIKCHGATGIPSSTP